MADILAMALALAGAYLLRNWTFDGLAVAKRHLQLGLLTLVVWPIVFARQNLYNARFITRRLDEFRRVFVGVLSGVIFVMVAGFLFKNYASRAWLLLLLVLGVMTVMIEREIARQAFIRMRSKGRFQRSVVMVGHNAEALEISYMLQTQPNLGYEVVGFVSDDDHDPDRPGNVLGTVEQTIDAVHRTGATGVIIATTSMDLDSANRLIRELTDAGIYVEMSSALRDIASQRLVVRPLGRYPVLCVEPVRRTGWRPVAKRAFDIVGSLAVLLVTSPVLVAAAVSVLVTGGRPIFFKQTRVGRDGKLFTIYKLRTMVPDAERRVVDLREHNEADGPLFKIEDDPRVTSVGRFLRKTSIDELPQLFNVLKGQMSLVGPRPALPSEVGSWSDALHGRLRVQPGITGMWQVSGRSSSSFKDYERLDLYYVDNWSLVSDLAIVAKTIPVVLFRKGAM